MAGAIALTLVLAATMAAQIRTLPVEGASDASFSGELASLEMEPGRRVEVESALTHRDYKRAEALLVEEAEREPKSKRAAKALALAGGIFFVDGQYLNSAIAWKRAEAITPLNERSRFSLAMAYVKLNHRDWARPELEKLAAAQPENALYLYWLARLDYDAKNYSAAIARLQRVVEIDPKMMRGYDTLGLCYDYVGQFDEALKNYDRAIELNRLQAKPSPWPHVDLAVSLIWVNRLADAEKSLREALTYDAQLPQAHYQLGRVLETSGKLQAAADELSQAAILDPAYPEPHFLLGRIYHRLNQTQKAEAEIATFQQLKKATEAGSSIEQEPSRSRQ